MFVSHHLELVCVCVSVYLCVYFVQPKLGILTLLCAFLQKYTYTNNQRVKPGKHPEQENLNKSWVKKKEAILTNGEVVCVCVWEREEGFTSRIRSTENLAKHSKLIQVKEQWSMQSLLLKIFQVPRGRDLLLRSQQLLFPCHRVDQINQGYQLQTKLQIMKIQCMYFTSK